MARRARGAGLETRSSRLKLPVAKKPLFVKIGLGIGLGYRRNMTAGTWVARIADGQGGNWTKAIATADDFDEADGKLILDFWQAQDRARAVARQGAHTDRAYDTGPVTVDGALDRYEADLRVRGGDIANNVARVRRLLPERLRRKGVASLTVTDLREWRDALTEDLAPASVNRTANALRAALNLAAAHDERIASRRAWEIGLSAIRDAERSRNVILAEAAIRAIIAEAYKESDEFGLLIETSAVTGARVGQLARLEVQDLQDERVAPRLMMPSSRKGHSRKVSVRRPVPIPVSLALRLRGVAQGRSSNDPLLLKHSGAPWKRNNHTTWFSKSVKRAGLDPSEISIYALRHSNIVRQLLAGIPVRVVAVNHDTSVTMIERTYSRHIGDHADALARKALLDIANVSDSNVVPITAAR